MLLKRLRSASICCEPRGLMFGSSSSSPRICASSSSVDRKSTRLNSSHLVISYAVFCLKKKKTVRPRPPAQELDSAADSRLLEPHLVTEPCNGSYAVYRPTCVHLVIFDAIQLQSRLLH